MHKHTHLLLGLFYGNSLTKMRGLYEHTHTQIHTQTHVLIIQQELTIWESVQVFLPLFQFVSPVLLQSKWFS